MRVYLVPQVARLVRKERLPEVALCRTAREVLAGTLGAGEADLGEGCSRSASRGRVAARAEAIA